MPITVNMYNHYLEEKEKEILLYFNFKMTRPQNELQTWYEWTIAGYYRS